MILYQLLCELVPTALKDIFIAAPVEGQSGYINLMQIKATYFEKGVFLRDPKPAGQRRHRREGDGDRP